MAWSTIRKATNEDVNNLEQRARDFCKRHDVEIWEGDTAVATIEREIEADTRAMSWDDELRAKELRPLWRKVVQRTLGNGAEGIAYGYVGYSAK